MINTFFRTTKHTLPCALTVLALTMLMSSCSVFTNDKVNYKSMSSAQPITLDVPPDLTQLLKDTRYNIPGEQISANAMGLNSSNSAQKTPTIGATKVSDLSLSRLGKDHWLSVQRPADTVWPLVKQFWLDSGFVLVKEDDKLGLLETDWAEYKSNEAQGFIGKTFNRLLGSVMSTGIKDKFVTQVESIDGKNVDIFIYHRSVEELSPTSSNPLSGLKMRAADPELESQFLKKLMLRLGASETQIAQAEQSLGNTTVARATLVSQDKAVKIVYQEGFDAAWRRVGLALDRSGFTVEDRDRKAGIYFVRFVDPTNAGKEAGFFSRLFSSSPKDEGPQRYRIRIQADGETQTSIAIQNSSGELEGSTAGAKIAQLLIEELK